MDNTLIVYTSDQGFLLGRTRLLRQAFHVRGVVPHAADHGVARAYPSWHVCRELVQNIDYAPTLLDAAGVEVPDGMDGVSLQPLFRSGKGAWLADVALLPVLRLPSRQRTGAHYGIRTDRYKLIHCSVRVDGDPDIDF